MKKFLNRFLCFIAIAIIIVVILIIIKFARNQANEREISEVLETIKTEAVNNEENGKKDVELSASYKGYKILGTIKIDKINIEYPILEYTSDDTLKISITTFWGEKVHQIGNFVVSRT